MFLGSPMSEVQKAAVWRILTLDGDTTRSFKQNRFGESDRGERL